MSIKNQYYIDKTRRLEKGIELFPSIYIEGAAGSGKTTAVKMLVDRYPEVQCATVDVSECCEKEIFAAELERIQIQMKTDVVWTVFENIPRGLSRDILKAMVVFVEKLPENCRVIFVGRERPGEELLRLLWNRKMDLLSAEMLLFAEEEIQKLVEMYSCLLSPAEIFAETGGWAGCVDLMIRLSLNEADERNVRELRDSYEISAYIQKEIMETLSEEEQEMMRRAEECPWLNTELAEEVWGISYAEDILKTLERKGLLRYHRMKKRWKLVPLFRRKNKRNEEQPPYFWEHMGRWYEEHGFVKEALMCLNHLDDREKYRGCMRRNYKRVPFLEYPYDEVMNWQDSSPESIYLRGMYCYSHRNFEGLRQEIQKLNPENGQSEKEIYLNLSYMNPDLTLDEWLELLERQTEDKQKVRLYNILGNAHTSLCGLRDLSGLFACNKKEEKHKARLWKERLGEEEWLAYQIAKIDYYVETVRASQISQEEWDLLESYSEEEAWQFRLAKLCLCCKLQGTEPTEGNAEQMRRLEESLMREDSEVCIRNTIALVSLYSHYHKEGDRMARWLRYSEVDSQVVVTEDNYSMLCCQAKGYLLLNQYDKAERIFRRVIPYLKEYKRTRFLAEFLFQQAIVRWKEKNRSQALQNVIESFFVNGESRYVIFYAGYGKQGLEVLDAYVDWFSSSWPEIWGKKKKYNYGNVLRMPWPDYMDFVLHYMRREEKRNPALLEMVVEEQLTMMEMIVLQNIGRGLTNAEICKELNLKMTTVKSHVYSLYKKLGVNSRVQAVLKGKELGMIEGAVKKQP